LGTNVTGFESVSLPNAVSATGSSFVLDTASVAANSTFTIDGSAHLGADANGTLIAAALTITAAAAAANAKVSITGGAGHDVLTGGAGNDTINGGNGNDTINSGDTLATVAGGVDRLDGGLGDDILIIGGDVTAAQAGSYTGNTGTDTLQIGTGGVARVVNLTGSTLTTLENLNLAANVAANQVTMTGAQYAGFTGAVTGNGADDVITLTTVPAAAVATGDSVRNFSVVEGTTLNIPAANTAVVVTETGTAGTVSTFVLAGTATYTGVWVGIDALDVIKLNTAGTYGVSGNTGLDTGAVYDFNSLSSTLVLNATQNGLAGTTFLNAAAGVQTIQLSAADTFTTNAVIEAYTEVLASTITLATGHTGVNIAAAAGTNTTVNIGGQTVTGTYALGDGTDVLIATTGANIAGVNAGALTTAEAITLTGAITMTLAQYDGFTFTAAGTADSVTLTTGGTVAANAVVETYTLGATAANVFTFSTIAQTVVGSTAADTVNVTMANLGAIATSANLGVDSVTDRVSITNTSIDASTSVLTVSNFNVANDAVKVTLNAAVLSGSTFVAVTAGGNAAVTSASGGVIEIQASNAADLTADGADGAIETLVAAAIGNIANDSSYTVVVYSGSSAGIYTMTTGTVAGTDLAANTLSLELVGVLTGVGVDALTAANFYG